MSQLQKGIVQVYTGTGKGKTTAALGLCLRAIGQGLRVCIIQFLKGGWQTGELTATARLAPELVFLTFGADRQARAGEGPWWEAGYDEQDYAAAREALEAARQALARDEYDLIVLDEINCALHDGLLSVQEVLELIEHKPQQTELVLTGRDAPQAIIERADLVTDMHEVKHPFRQGVKARKGIEY